MIDDTSGQKFLTVGIGASAGGLDALQRFLAALPKDFGFALVFVQHLSRTHKNLLQELLSVRYSSLAIQQISDGLKIQPGRLYLAPPGGEIRVLGGFFRTAVHPEGLIHLPIDEFLASLAEDAGERAIAVILSGAGTDGARGCRTIRAAGGTVLAQDPRTAEFDSMPVAAIATGQADAVLSPEDIAEEILKLQDMDRTAVGSEHPVTPQEYTDVFRILQEKTGARFNHYKKSVVSRRIRRRMHLHGISTVKGYLDLIAHSDPEAAHLASDLLIGVTAFFRDRVAWKALNLEVIRKIIAEQTTLPVRVWTPASATGEEAYSIAMMLLYELGQSGKNRDVQVFATDVNERALERAREGRYPAGIAADMQADYVRRFFTPADEGDVLVINKIVRDSVVFARQDLLTDPPFSKLDLIICRNLLIYLEPEAQEKSISLFHYALKDDGFLFLGNAETVGRRSALFKSIGHKQCRIYRKLPAKADRRLPLSVPYAAERRAAPAKQTEAAPRARPITEIIQEKLLEEYGPASVAIDQNYEIIYHNGFTNRYLCQPRGAPTRNLLELVPESLRSRIRGALYRSGREDKPVAVRTGLTGNDGKKRHVTLRITNAADNLYLVVFLEKSAPPAKEAVEQLDAGVIEETAIHQLESELAATRADLQTRIEQLKSLNEELQSSNEELQAANEELETSREELQSLNEELITVNAQLQGKIEEQDATNNDLNNFMTSTNLPVIFLDTQFRVKRFTPAMLKLIKLLPSDVGRPLVDMSLENLGPGLTADAQIVLETLAPTRRELDIGGVSYIRTILPYRTADNRIEGVVVTYNDVTELKRAEDRTRHLASFPQLNPNPVIEVDAAGGVIFANPSAKNTPELLGMDRGDVRAYLPKDLDVILQELKRGAESSVRREVTVKDRTFSETIQFIPQFDVARIYAFDITERKAAEEALRRSERRYRSFIEVTSQWAWVTDPAGFVGEDIPALRTFTGQTYEQARGAGWADALHPDDVQRTLEVWNRAVSTRTPYETEYRMRRYDGVYRVLLARGVPILDDLGNVIEWVGTCIDITERKAAEEALRKAHDELERRVEERTALLHQTTELAKAERQRFYDVLETLPVYVCLLTPEYRMPFANRIFREWFGCSPDRKCHEFLFERSEPCENCQTYTVLKTNAPQRWEWTGPNGRNYDIFDFPFTDTDGSRLILEMGIDITERKQAEKALRELNATLEQRIALRTAELSESERRLNRSQEIAHLGSWELDLVSNRLFWSDEVYRIFGLEPQEFGASYEAFLEAVHPDDRAAVDAAYSDSLRENKDAYEIEHRIVRKKTGEVRYVHEKCAHFRDAAGRITRSVGMVNDITERKKAEADILKLSEDMAARNLELETANKEMESFVYSVSHDLRAPLRALSGFSKIVMEDYADKLDALGRDYLARILNGADRMTHLINDLLQLSKLSRQEIDRIDIDLSKLAENVIQGLRETSPARTVEVTIEPGLRASVDPNLMRVVLTNLMDNAWKFTGKTANARIEFGAIESQVSGFKSQVSNSELRTRNFELVYFVRDNGTGFDPTYAHKMFWPFHRLHSETEYEGTGIGLAIVERVIRRHGGSVWAEGEVGKGATFYFTLG